MIEPNLFKRLVVSFYTAGPYDIIIIQTSQGDLVTIRIEEYEQQ